MKEVKQGIYSTGGHSNKRERERETGWTGVHKRGGTLNIYTGGEQ